MKKLILAAVLATLAGSAANAQSYSPGYGSGNIVPGPGGAFAYHQSFAADRSARGAYAQAPGAMDLRTSRIVGFDGAVEGDADPNIAFQLHREAQEGW